MDDENNADDLTPEESEDMEEIDETAEETHRAVEYDDIRARLDGITKTLESMQATIALFISNAGGSADTETDTDDIEPVLEDIPQVEDLDLTI